VMISIGKKLHNKYLTIESSDKLRTQACKI